MRHWQIGMCLVLLVTGCMPHTVVRQNPGPHDKGIRYYRPKPYLLVQPTPVAEDAEIRHDKYVQISLEYLPDFSEEYSIDVRSGFGKNKTSVKLANGWNLTEINQELDSSVDENIKAIGDLLKSVAPGGIVPTAGDAMRGPTMVIGATNVPLGYYESVIDRGQDGKKRLFGWRYVGFYPFSACPLRAQGVDCVDCHVSAAYGLVFREGVMTFELIHDIAQASSSAIEQMPAPGRRWLPLSEETLTALASRAKEAVNKQIAVGANTFVVTVEESRPHLVFTFITPNAASMKELLHAHEGDLAITLDMIIKQETRQSYSAVIRVMSESSLPEPVVADPT